GRIGGRGRRGRQQRHALAGGGIVRGRGAARRPHPAPRALPQRAARGRSRDRAGHGRIGLDAAPQDSQVLRGWRRRPDGGPARAAPADRRLRIGKGRALALVVVGALLALVVWPEAPPGATGGWLRAAGLTPRTVTVDGVGVRYVRSGGGPS